MRALLGFTIAAACAAPVTAADEGTSAGSDDVLSKVTFGSTWYGPDIKVEDLKGRVVLIEFWGRN